MAVKMVVVMVVYLHFILVKLTLSSHYHLITISMFITHAGCIAASVGRAISRVCLFVCLSVLSVCPCSKRLELSTPNLVHMYSIAVALTQRSKSQGHMVTKTARSYSC